MDMPIQSKLIRVLLCCIPIIFNTFNGNGVVMASHKVYPNYQSVSAVKVKQVYRTAFHFQPKQHWINGTNSSFSYFL
ncbi:putative beta-fructofuranosidase [Helianthus anomalus]